MPIFNYIRQELSYLADKKKAGFLNAYFKTEKGEYGEGDTFLGISVPNQRKIAKKYQKQASFEHVGKLLKSSVHEHRFTGLEILVFKFEHAKTEKERKQIVTFYLKNKKYINNWDLVDTSAPYIIGEFLLKKPRQPLYTLAASKNIWERRIAIVSTYTFIKRGQFGDTFKLAKLLVKDPHHLIHKATGWMLREVGKKDMESLINFLDAYKSEMPRVMLRYAIERFPEHIREIYLSSKAEL